jgi:hypothetical protein
MVGAGDRVGRGVLSGGAAIAPVVGVGAIPTACGSEPADAVQPTSAPATKTASARQARPRALAGIGISLITCIRTLRIEHAECRTAYRSTGPAGSKH